jgi:hypothetical protein
MTDDQLLEKLGERFAIERENSHHSKNLIPLNAQRNRNPRFRLNVAADSHTTARDLIRRFGKEPIRNAST